MAGYTQGEMWFLAWCLWWGICCAVFFGYNWLEAHRDRRRRNRSPVR